MEWLLTGIPSVVIAIVLSVVFFVVLFVGIFWLVGRLTARIADRIASEGTLVMRSGPQWMNARIKDYKAPGVYLGHTIAKKRGEALLTDGALVVVFGVLVLRFANADLSSAEVSLDGDRLRFTSSKPTAATGHVELAFPTPDNAAWKRALVERGARES
jgi:hypothetical protein